MRSIDFGSARVFDICSAPLFAHVSFIPPSCPLPLCLRCLPGRVSFFVLAACLSRPRRVFLFTYCRITYPPLIDRVFPQRYSNACPGPSSSCTSPIFILVFAFAFAFAGVGSGRVWSGCVSRPGVSFVVCCSLVLLLQAKKEAEFAEAPGTITMDDLPPAPANGAAAGGGGGGSTASRDVTPPSAGMTVPYADLKG